MFVESQDWLIFGKVDFSWVWFGFAIFHSSFVSSASIMYFWVVIFSTWNWQEESDSERESIDSPGSRKPAKRKRGKIELGVSKDSVQSQSIASNDGCLSLLKRRRFDGDLPFIEALALL